MSFISRFFERGMEKPDEMAERRRQSYEKYPIEGHMTRHMERDAVRVPTTSPNLAYDSELVLGVHSWAAAGKLYDAYRAETDRRRERRERVVEIDES
mmetsp:Transcript_165835/g.403013  ORF Transcript_165835/g.403013 Transcript_165835/m.403013 type:complete len:97 (-) Transcript_165835:168-458(-)